MHSILTFVTEIAHIPWTISVTVHHGFLLRGLNISQSRYEYPQRSHILTVPYILSLVLFLNALEEILKP